MTTDDMVGYAFLVALAYRRNSGHMQLTKRDLACSETIATSKHDTYDSCAQTSQHRMLKNL